MGTPPYQFAFLEKKQERNVTKSGAAKGGQLPAFGRHSYHFIGNSRRLGSIVCSACGPAHLPEPQTRAYPVAYPPDSPYVDGSGHSSSVLVWPYPAAQLAILAQRRNGNAHLLNYLKNVVGA